MSIGAGYACVPCQTYLRPRKNEIVVLETDDKHKPYKIWLADLWECPDCGHQVILGYGLHHISEHYEPDFDRYLKRVTHTILGCPRGLPDELPHMAADPLLSSVYEAMSEAVNKLSVHASSEPYLGDVSNGYMVIDGECNAEQLRILAAFLRATT